MLNTLQKWIRPECWDCWSHPTNLHVKFLITQTLISKILKF